MNDLEHTKKRGTFAQCSFIIVRSASLGPEQAQELAGELRLHDGEVIFDDYPENNLDLNGVTHVVSATYDFPDYHACVEAFIPVVRPTWVTHSLAKNKLLNPRQYNPDPRYFMSDVVACVADLPEGDADAIAGGILAMGGLFSLRLTNQVTHVIALTVESDVCHRVIDGQLRIKVVLPHWVDDCLKLGRKIDEHPYSLPDPDILKGPTEKVPIAKRKTQVEGAVNPDPSQEGQEPVGPRKLNKVFKKKTVMLSKDLRISNNLREILDGIVTTSGGKLTDSVMDADMFICKYRSGEEYRMASRAGKDVGNLAWLYYLIQTDEWTSPLRRMLHYPVAREGLPGFQGLKISLSNYSGDARTYLENLIYATGAECTKTLKQDNTHLITAHVLSEKCAAAKDWGIHIINHLWLEESYAQWTMKSITDNKYTHFPRRTNLGEVVGHTQLDRTVLERHFFPPEEDVEMADVADAKPMQQVNNNTISATRLDQAQNHDSDARERNGKPRTPAPSKFITTGKENITPSTTNSRKSKEVASARLHEMTPDILLYEKERKRAGGVIYGGRRKTDEGRIEVGRKRSVDEASDHETTEGEAKKVKRENTPPAMHLVISGYDKWVGRAKLEDNDKKRLRSLGVVCTMDPSRATHLVAPRVVRTMKFVTALAYAPMVLSTSYIEACLEANELLDPGRFRLTDKESEKKLGVSLKLSRERAQKNRNQLLQGRTIYCMEDIRGGFDTFKTIVDANGGDCRLWRGRKGTTVPSKRADSEASTDIDATNDVYLLSNDTDRKETTPLWTRFKEMAEGSRKIPRIVSADWLLETAMSQKLLPTQQYELED
ncbi:regulator of Ty1 Transposition [Knufia peltigerae]|uniref:Regulator of Ty1 Transposition n=1 Tax=Knufia peltigerae TaxID=1002370 RepID=A0AA38Y801_9EURO|nr:regulator of Ty1 Transposition [Knufia peltigerae]